MHVSWRDYLSWDAHVLAGQQAEFAGWLTKPDWTGHRTLLPEPPCCSRLPG